MPPIVSLDRAADFARVRDLFRRGGDYMRLETGLPPDDATVAEFFDDFAPGTDPAEALKIGWEDGGGRLSAIADVSFGYPGPGDCYIGLLLVDAAARGGGIGRAMLDHVADTARRRGARRLLVAVLEANPRGLAFWTREGFVEDRRFPPTQMGARSHVRIRLSRAPVTSRWGAAAQAPMRRAP